MAEGPDCKLHFETGKSWRESDAAQSDSTLLP